MQRKQDSYYLVIYENTFTNKGMGIEYITIQPNRVARYNLYDVVGIADNLRQRFPESENYRVEIVRHTETFDTFQSH
jgi:hypothetical protein